MFSEEFFNRIDKQHQQRRQEFEKLACEPCMKEACVGDRVLVAAGPVCRGFEWGRIEGTVLEISDSAYKVEFVRKISGGPDIEWIHKFCITDVLGPPPCSDTGAE